MPEWEDQKKKGFSVWTLSIFLLCGELTHIPDPAGSQLPCRSCPRDAPSWNRELEQSWNYVKEHPRWARLFPTETSWPVLC